MGALLGRDVLGGFFLITMEEMSCSMGYSVPPAIKARICRWTQLP